MCETVEPYELTPEEDLALEMGVVGSRFMEWEADAGDWEPIGLRLLDKGDSVEEVAVALNPYPRTGDGWREDMRDFEQKRNREIARRIAACWNACRWMDTEAVEQQGRDRFAERTLRHYDEAMKRSPVQRQKARREAAKKEAAKP
jgi:hypothetical protein